MRATLTLSVLALASLATAGSSLALIDTVSETAAYAQATAEGTTDFASQLAADAQAKADLLTAVAHAAASNAAGQGAAAVNFAIMSAIEAKQTAEVLLLMELQAVVGAANSADDLPSCVSSDDPFGAVLQTQACATMWLNALVEA